ARGGLLLIGLAQIPNGFDPSGELDILTLRLSRVCCRPCTRTRRLRYWRFGTGLQLLYLLARKGTFEKPQVIKNGIGLLFSGAIRADAERAYVFVKSGILIVLVDLLAINEESRLSSGRPGDREMIPFVCFPCGAVVPCEIEVRRRPFVALFC